MKYEKYVSLIEELEKYSASNRSGYELRVFLLIALGYGYFVGLIVLLLLPVFLIILGLYSNFEAVGRLLLQLAKLWWVIVPGLVIYFGFIGSAVRAITARGEAPNGVPLDPKIAPELIRFIDSVCKELKAQKPKQILIVDEFNAAVVTLPRFGIFGRKVVLLLGLPLMKALSPEQFKAVLAHEIGHISGKHGSFAKWAYQMREAWGRLIDSQELNDHKFSSLYKNFVEWFFPYFSAYSFVLMREHERDADRDAAKIVGANELGEALVLLQTKTASLGEVFWRKVHEENMRAEVPTKHLFSRMIAALNFVDQDKSQEVISQALAVPTDYGDTHPSLAERLRLIGFTEGEEIPFVQQDIQENAADHFLGAEVANFTGKFDEKWDEDAAKEWKVRHRHFQDSEKRIQELNEKESKESLTGDELLEIASRIAEKENVEAALPYVERAVAEFPENPNAHYNLGQIRLILNDETGILDLERAAEMDSTFKLGVSETIFGYLRSKGRFEDAKAYAASMEGEYENWEKAKEERNAINPMDKFETHSLSNEFIEMIARKLSGLDEITAIYAVRKVCHYMPEIPMQVIFIALRKKTRFKNRNDLGAAEIVNIVAERLDTGEIGYFQALAAEFAEFERVLSGIEGAKVFEQQSP